MKRLLRGSVNVLPLQVRHWIKHIPMIASAQRWLVNGILSDAPFVHTINAGPARGLRFEVTLPKDKAIWAGTFESQFASTWQRGVMRGDVCFDIGGYRGYMSGVAALAGASKVVVCEPLPENIAALQTLCKLNPQLPIAIESVAIGSENGHATFKVMSDQSMGKLAMSPFQPQASSAKEIAVEVTKLDTLVFDRLKLYPKLLKIDVEGAEVDVLEGGKRTLAELRPRIYLEAHSAALGEECTSRLIQAGYKVRQLEKDQVPPEEARHLIAEPL